MQVSTAGRSNAQRLSRIAALLAIGGLVSALIAAVGSGSGAWPFGTGFIILRYAFFAAVAGGVLAVGAMILRWHRVTGFSWLDIVSLTAALLFSVFLLGQIFTARSVPAIHDVATDIDNLPRFTTLQVRADNLANIPNDGRPDLAALDPANRWKALHRQAYGDLVPLRVPASVDQTVGRAEALARKRGWAIAKVDRAAGVVEATATSLFFRFKDDVVVRVRPDPLRRGGAVVDMRSISRVGGSDVGVNAERIRSFLADLRAQSR